MGVGVPKNSRTLWRVNYDVSWRHNNVTKPPFWIWGRHLESQTCSHAADNDVTKNIWFCSKKHTLSKQAQKSRIISSAYKRRRKPWKKTEKRQKIVKIHFWEDGCYGNLNHHRHVIDIRKFSLINFRKSDEIWWKVIISYNPPPPGRIGLRLKLVIILTMRNLQS